MCVDSFELLEQEYCDCPQGKCSGRPGKGRICGASADIVEAINKAAAEKADTLDDKLLTKRFGPKIGSQPEKEN